MPYINASADFSTSYFFGESAVQTESLGELYQEAVKENLGTKMWFAFRSVVLEMTMKVINMRIDKIKKRYDDVLDGGKVILKGKSFILDGAKGADGQILSTPQVLADKFITVTSTMKSLIELIESKVTNPSEYEKLLDFGNYNYNDRDFQKYVKNLSRQVKSDEDITMTKDEAVSALNEMDKKHKQASDSMNIIIHSLRNKNHQMMFEWIDDKDLQKTIKQVMNSILKIYMFTMTSWVKYFNAFRDADLVK